MQTAALKHIDGNKIQLTGALNFDTVPALQQQLTKLLPFMPDIILDLSAVSFCDSAGVALLLECKHTAKRLSKPLVFQHIPAQLMALTKAMTVNEIIGI